MPTISPLNTVGNVIVSTPALSDSATIIKVGSEVGSLPGVNVQSPNLSPNIWRASDPTKSYIVFDLGAGKGRWNMLAAMGIKATSHGNASKRSGDLTHADWIKALSTVAAHTTVADPFGGQGAFRIQDNTTSGRHMISQAITKDVAEELNFSQSIWARADQFENVILKNAGVSIGDNATAKYDLVTQVISVSSSGGYSNVAVSIENDPPGSSWYRCKLVGRTDNSATYIPQFMMSDSTGNQIYAGTGTDGLLFYGPMTEMGRTVVGTYAETTSDTAARMRVSASHDLSHLNSDTISAATPFNSGVMPLIPESGDFSDWESLSALYWSDTILAYRYVRWDILDPDNILGYIDTGRIFIDDGWEVEINPHPGFIFPGKVSDRRRTTTLSGRRQVRSMRGRQIASGQITITDTVEAMERYLEIARTVSLSGDVLFIVDAKGLYTMRGMLHGAFEEFAAPTVTNRGYYKVRFKLEEI